MRRGGLRGSAAAGRWAPCSAEGDHLPARSAHRQGRPYGRGRQVRPRLTPGSQTPPQRLPGGMAFSSSRLSSPNSSRTRAAGRLPGVAKRQAPTALRTTALGRTGPHRPPGFARGAPQPVAPFVGRSTPGSPATPRPRPAGDRSARPPARQRSCRATGALTPERPRLPSPLAHRVAPATGEPTAASQFRNQGSARSQLRNHGPAPDRARERARSRERDPHHGPAVVRISPCGPTASPPCATPGGHP